MKWLCCVMCFGFCFVLVYYLMFYVWCGRFSVLSWCATFGLVAGDLDVLLLFFWCLVCYVDLLFRFCCGVRFVPRVSAG